MAKKRKKQIRKDEALTFSSVYDYRDYRCKSSFEITKFFDNNQPISLELGCGIGVYTNNLAQNNREQNYIGIDMKAERIWRAAKTSQEKNIINTKYIIGNIDLIDKWFEPKSISEIWITFPDPHPRKKMAKKRLTSPKFLNLYKKILTSGGVVHLKTDDEDLFTYTQDIIDNNFDINVKMIETKANIYQQKKLPDVLKYKTRFEQKWLDQNKKIFYIKFSLLNNN